ncbi:unnamed protein product [Cyprideis torosa]|uniref:Uncharacterized protein n=1 Tax=Cyprideis torosa TaxID=163714 RepID=A0A7R8W742_9CRUS|nr:unnamed protein product [Cyprideis torosa]CAG0882350.1 unnamed protein product [Cyprideis torosa]
MVPISLVLVVLVAIFYLRKWNRWRRMPPGPWGWPIVGSAFSVSVRRPWDSYSKLARKFGGIMSVSMSMSAEDIIISDYDLALEFFNKPEFTPRPMHMFVLDIRDGGPEGAG